MGTAWFSLVAFGFVPVWRRCSPVPRGPGVLRIALGPAFLEALASELRATLVPPRQIAFHARRAKIPDVEERPAARRLDDVIERVRDAGTSR
jgi:hypothetical protein